TDSPHMSTMGVQNLAGDLVGSRHRPPARFEIKKALVSGGVIGDFHQTIVVNRRSTGNDTNHGSSNFLPCVQLFFPTNWSQPEKPCSQRIDVKGLSIKLGLDCGFAPIIPFGCFCPGCTNWWVMTNLFDEEP